MRVFRTLLAGVTCFALATSAIGAPPEDKGGGKGGGNDGGGGADPLQSFDPEIAYRETSKRNGQKLWLTDRNTTFQVEVAQSQSPIVGFDLSSEKSKLIAYDIDGTVYIRGWQTGPFKLTDSPQILFTNSTMISNVDFNRDDTKLAWVISKSGEDFIYVHDFTSGQTVLQPLRNHHVQHVRFSPTDNSIFFTGSSDLSNTHNGLYRYSLGSTVATKIVDRLPGNYNDTNFDVTRPSSSGTPLIVMSDDRTPRFFTLAGQSRSKDFLGFGEKFTFNCSNSALLYLESGIRKGGLSITPFGGSIEVLDIPWDKHSDWMRRAPCD